LLTLTDVRRVPREEWGTTSVYRSMTPVSELKTVSLNADLADVLSLMASGNLNQIPLVERGLLRGMIERSDIINFIQAQQTLGSDRKAEEVDSELTRLGR